MNTTSLLIEFAPGTALHRESDRRSDLPIHRNGPPGTFVVFPDTGPLGAQGGALRVSLPTDQIVLAEERDGAVRVGFGGFRFDGVQDGRLTFSRVRDLLPEDQLSPARSWTMTLDPAWVASVDVAGVRAWPVLGGNTGGSTAGSTAGLAAR